MSTLENKIDFIALVSVKMANCNGDPLNDNRPRTDYNSFGMMSAECVKRKLRNRMQDLGHPIFIQSNDRCQDEYTNLNDRASDKLGKIKDQTEYAKKACETWLDVRTFGQVFSFSRQGQEEKGVSIGVRGPVSIHQAMSISPVEVESMQITKSVNGNKPEKGKAKASDTMGMKHFVRFGLYKIKGAINVQLAEKTGFTQQDADTFKECLRTLFVNDASAARPDGSMEVVRLYWWQHNCKIGQYSSAKVHRSLKISLKDPDGIPSGLEDYDIILDPLDGLSVEIIDGI